MQRHEGERHERYEARIASPGGRFEGRCRGGEPVHTRDEYKKPASCPVVPRKRKGDDGAHEHDERHEVPGRGASRVSGDRSALDPAVGEVLPGDTTQGGTD